MKVAWQMVLLSQNDKHIVVYKIEYSLSKSLKEVLQDEIVDNLDTSGISIFENDTEQKNNFI